MCTYRRLQAFRDMSTNTALFVAKGKNTIEHETNEQNLTKRNRYVHVTKQLSKTGKFCYCVWLSRPADACELYIGLRCIYFHAGKKLLMPILGKRCIKVNSKPECTINCVTFLQNSVLNTLKPVRFWVNYSRNTIRGIFDHARRMRKNSLLACGCTVL